MARFCSNCGKPVGDQDLFCSECGARLDAATGEAGASPTPAAQTPGTPAPVPVGPRPAAGGTGSGGGPALSLDTNDRGAMAALAGAVLTVVAVFVKAVSVSLLGLNISFMDLSKPAGIVLILSALIGAYGILSKVRCLAVGAGSGILITFLAVLFKYEQMISELKKGFFGAMASQAISLSAGVYLLLIAAILLIAGALVSSLNASHTPLNAGNLLNGWKENLMTEFHVSTIPLHAWIITVAVPILVYVAVTQGDLYKGMMR